jgi:hypothetical protein
VCLVPALSFCYPGNGNGCAGRRARMGLGIGGRAGEGRAKCFNSRADQVE